MDPGIRESITQKKKKVAITLFYGKYPLSFIFPGNNLIEQKIQLQAI